MEASIQPSPDPQVFDTSNDVVSALKNEQVDAIVVDVPTAFFLTAVQVPEGTPSASSRRREAMSGARCSRRTRR